MTATLIQYLPQILEMEYTGFINTLPTTLQTTASASTSGSPHECITEQPTQKPRDYGKRSPIHQQDAFNIALPQPP
ncbi:hypothetical protein CHS0354_035085 [Potamilus streckersoni]|uniref:Uncharacterized protein n=1 Tax=Potamilus streckersoni TaxID=2493646 RepID=A0AAE0RY44_9BIVA|nr:hypothetical protein CHS0354_035085 [Potamilus streckersoni]